ncbi:MAG: CAAX prenyl protease-related protein [Verrucomicrobiae bacterium]|nr:CAAX prenyl protease-related protein [Verrucomicrobiae bacterium]
MNERAVKRTWPPYVVPMAAYLLVTLAESSENVVYLYPLKTVLVAALLWMFRNRYEELTPSFSVLDVAVGLVAIGFWILLDPFYPKLGGAGGQFDPSGRWAFIFFRVCGAVLVVPLMEELFWRGFFIRWLVNEEFKKVPVGHFTPASFAITTVLFGVEHREWLAGLICGAFYNWLYYRRKSVFACVTAHATSNAALAAWVLWRNDWKFW